VCISWNNKKYLSLVRGQCSKLSRNSVDYLQVATSHIRTIAIFVLLLTREYKEQKWGVSS